MEALDSNAKSRRGALCRSPRGSHGPSTSADCVARFRLGPSLAAGGRGALRERLQSPAPTSASVGLRRQDNTTYKINRKGFGLKSDHI